MSHNDDKNRQARIEALAKRAGRSVHDIMMFVERDGLEYTEDVVDGLLEAIREVERGEIHTREEAEKEIDDMLEQVRNERRKVKHLS